MQTKQGIQFEIFESKTASASLAVLSLVTLLLLRFATQMFAIVPVEGANFITLSLSRFVAHPLDAAHTPTQLSGQKDTAIFVSGSLVR